MSNKGCTIPKPLAYNTDAPVPHPVVIVPTYRTEPNKLTALAQFAHFDATAFDPLLLQVNILHYWCHFIL